MLYSFRVVFKMLQTFFALLVIYFLTAVYFSLVTVNTNFTECKKDAVEIYLLSNGVHTDIVVPLKNDQKDWTKFVSPAATQSGSSFARFVAFGWGDKGFYLNTKTWADLKFKTAFNALFFLSSTAMHVSYYYQPKESATCRKICISKESNAKLIVFIENSFLLDKNGLSQQISDAHYFTNDAFYEAKGTYSLFYTCNTWTNNGLKSANLRACAWTPFDKGIFYQYDY